MASGIFDPQMIELFYQAALEPDYWPQALAGLLPAYRSKHVSFYTAPVLENRAAMFAQHGFTEAELKIQFSPEAMQNWESWRAMSPVARTFTNRHLMSAAEWERSKAYNEFVKHSGVYHGAILQQMTPDTSFYFALCRPNPADLYTDEELTSLQSALSHLTYALRLQTRLRLAEQRTHVLRAALDGIGEGALIVDAKGVPVIVNARAQALLDLGDGILAPSTGLRAAQPEFTLPLLSAIAAAADPSSSGSRKIHLPRRRSRFPLLLEIMPVSRFNADMHGAGQAAALIFITEPDAPYKINFDALGDTMHLTQRELEVVNYLVQGISTDKIAAKLDISLTTVRFHMKNAFQKTGTRSQTELAALIRQFATS